MFRIISSANRIELARIELLNVLTNQIGATPIVELISQYKKYTTIIESFFYFLWNTMIERLTVTPKRIGQYFLEKKKNEFGFRLLLFDESLIFQECILILSLILLLVIDSIFDKFDYISPFQQV